MCVLIATAPSTRSSNEIQLGNYLMIDTALVCVCDNVGVSQQCNSHSELPSHTNETCSLMTAADGAAGSQPQLNLELKVEFLRFLMELRPICLRNFLPVTSS